MAMIRHTDEPGTPAWHARRARCFNAGDASAMLGCHPSGKTRTQLLQELHSGLEREFSDYVQERVINPGHRVEHLWRPIAEAIIGDDLGVLGGSLEVGLSRPLGASLDGITGMDDVLGECKSMNDALRAALPHEGRDSHQHNDARNLPKGYRVQCEQQQMVTGAAKTLFSAMAFDAEGNPTEERHCWYTSDPELRAEILAGWKQFDVDLAAHVQPAAPAQVVVAAPVQALPAVSVVVEGKIAIRENFDAFEVAMRDFLEHRLIRTPKTDQDFADLDVQIKAMKGAEAALDTAEAGWIAQIEAVSTAKRRKDMLRSLVRENRLLAEKLLTSEKERRRTEIVTGGTASLQQHVASLNQRIGKAYMPASASTADFAGCIKGMRSLASMEDAVATRLAAAKIAANEIADRIQVNMGALRELASEHAFLFADTSTLVLKAPDDCRAVISSRIGEHKAEAERKLEAERARIRAEEEEKAQAEARQRNAMAMSEIEGIRQQVMIATLGRAGVRKGGTIECIRETLAETERWPITEDNFGVLTGAAQAAKDGALANIRKLLADAEARQQQPAAQAPAATPAPSPAPSPAVSTIEAFAEQRSTVVAIRPPAASATPTLRLGEIQRRLAPLSVDAAGLATLGFPFAKQEGAAKLWHEHQFDTICDALIAHIAAAQRQQQQAA